jgi:hypothetical protein
VATLKSVAIDPDARQSRRKTVLPPCKFNLNHLKRGSTLLISTLAVSMTSKRSDGAICTAIRTWITEERDKYACFDTDGAIDYQRELIRQSLQVGELNFLEMEDSQRYFLPNTTQTAIVKYLRGHLTPRQLNIQRRRDRKEIWNLFDTLGIGREASQNTHKLFLQLCRNKVVNFLRTKGQSLIKLCAKYGYFEEWPRWTIEWLDPCWNGIIEEPASCATLVESQNAVISNSLEITKSASFQTSKILLDCSVSRKKSYPGDNTSKSQNETDHMIAQDARKRRK